MRAVCFDLDGTLLRMERGYGDVLADAFEAVAGTHRESWLVAYDDAFSSRFRDCGPEPVRYGARRTAETTDFDGDPEAFAAALLREEVGAAAPAPDATATLAALGEEYRVGVVTNGLPNWQREKLAAHGLDEHVDAVVTSYEAGHHKPHRAPFDLAADRLGADEYGMVGDDDADVEGASSVGWAVARYDGGELGDVPAALGWQ